MRLYLAKGKGYVSWVFYTDEGTVSDFEVIKSCAKGSLEGVSEIVDLLVSAFNSINTYIDKNGGLDLTIYLPFVRILSWFDDGTCGKIYTEMFNKCMNAFDKINSLVYVESCDNTNSNPAFRFLNKDKFLQSEEIKSKNPLIATSSAMDFFDTI